MFIRTARLFLRPPWPEDAPVVHEAIADWEIVRMLGRAPWPYALSDARSYVARPPDPGCAKFVIFLRTDGAPVLIGTIGYGCWDEGADGAPEMGYWIAREHWGRGYAVEAGRGVLELAFEGFGHAAMVAAHAADNARSGAVLRKLGFAPSSTVAPIRCHAGGEEVDGITYRLTRERWRAHAGARRKTGDARAEARAAARSGAGRAGEQGPAGGRGWPCPRAALGREKSR